MYGTPVDDGHLDFKLTKPWATAKTSLLVSAWVWDFAGEASQDFGRPYGALAEWAPFWVEVTHVLFEEFWLSRGQMKA